MLDMARLIRALIGRDVPTGSSGLEKEDIEQFTTIHQAIVRQYATQPIQTIKIEKRGKIQ